MTPLLEKNELDRVPEGDLAQRFPENPILRPQDLVPSRGDLQVECVLNPGVFELGGRTGLLLRVAEGAVSEEGWVSAPVSDPTSEGGIRVLRVRRDNPDLAKVEPRGFEYQGRGYLTTLSHLRLAWSDDGIHFTPESAPLLVGEGPHETFGIEDCRVERLEGRFQLTYTAVSEAGVAVGLISTTDWKNFTRHGLIFPPHNKDVALFPQRIGGVYHALHRPSGLGLGGHYIWLSRSTDLCQWGGHVCLAKTRPGMWDSERIGAGAAPIRTDAGWLEIYHGADHNSRYCLGALLLDLELPTKVLARSRTPIMEPRAGYEQKGFFGNVVFSNGHVVQGDRIRLYYGASDSVVCGADFSLSSILKTLTEQRS